MAIGVASVSLVLTLLLYFRGLTWLLPSLVSYLVLAGLIYIGNKYVDYVPYEDSSDESGRPG